MNVDLNFLEKYFTTYFLKLNFEKVKKRNFFIIDSNYKKITKKKHLSFEVFFIYRIYNIGIKIHPFIIKNKNKKNRNTNLDEILDLWAKLFMYFVLFKKEKKKIDLFSLFIKFYTNHKHKKKRVLRFSFNFMIKIFHISFEESANEIKFIFNIDFVKAIFLQNLILRNCWVVSNFSFGCFLEYCKNYVLACYNSMTKCKTFFKKHQIEYNSNGFFRYDKHEYDFFHIKKNTIGYNLNTIAGNLEIFSNKYKSKSNEYCLKWKKKKYFPINILLQNL